MILINSMNAGEPCDSTCEPAVDANLPQPTAAQKKDPAFRKIREAIDGWYIQIHRGAGYGYACDAHALLIYRALKNGNKKRTRRNRT